MRPLIGRTPAVLARRWLTLERLARLTLRRDAYADTPGPTLGLAIGERTHYRAAAWVLDTFERGALGAGYEPWAGAPALVLVNGRVEPASVGAAGMMTHTRTCPRDAWAAVVIGALAGDAAVGVLLRAASDASTGYRITATPGATLVERLDAGGWTTLGTVPTPWRPGETLRAVFEWDRCRVYRDAILVADVHDAGPHLAGLAGLVARRGDVAAEAAIASVLAGDARQEYLGAGLDLGDVQRVIGQPASFDLTLSNLAPMGGKDRFAALLRHGRNDGAGTYDLDRGDVRVLTVVDGAPAPLTSGVGLIESPAEVTEDRVKLVCRGRDAFLTPIIRPGAVHYLAGPPPGGLLPLPSDPCAPSAPPVIVAGAVPPEPVDPPGTNEVPGIGPEAPPDADDGGPALAGAWIVTFDYHLELVDGATIYVGTTNVIRLPQDSDPPGSDTPGGGGIIITQRDGFQADKQTRIGSTGAPVVDGTADFPAYWVETLTYRGPDIAGGQIQRDARWSAGDNAGLYPKAYIPAGNVEAGVEFKLVSYSGATIKSEGDLAALRPPNPGTDPRPGRIGTLATWTGNVTLRTDVCSPDPHADATWFQVTTPAGGVVGPVSPFSAGPVAGPQIFRIEITPAPVPSTVAVRANLFTRQPGTDSNVFAGSGPCGAGMHHFRTLATPADMSGFSVR